jgi:hypothetical protein
VVDTSTNHLAASDIFLLYFAFHPEARMQMWWLECYLLYWTMKARISLLNGILLEGWKGVPEDFVEQSTKAASSQLFCVCVSGSWAWF